MLKPFPYILVKTVHLPVTGLRNIVSHDCESSKSSWWREMRLHKHYVDGLHDVIVSDPSCTVTRGIIKVSVTQCGNWWCHPIFALNNWSPLFFHHCPFLAIVSSPLPPSPPSTVISACSVSLYLCVKCCSLLVGDGNRWRVWSHHIQCRPEHSNFTFFRTGKF